ncbi:MAG: type II secretion system protein GspK [Thermodesulfovibrionia bacterium]|nr:type II secretion system protein GspK [Thermodesulfovibrionia bacterium]
MCDKIEKAEINPLLNEKGGAAFILVIWIVVMLLVIVAEFSNTMRTELKITSNFKEEEEAYQLALAGFEQAKVEIMSVPGDAYVYFDGDGVLSFEKQGGDLNNGADEGFIFKRDVQLGKGSFKYTIIDESGKLNLNTASVTQLRYIIENTGVETEITDIVVDSIIDWRDPNSLHMINGAEEEYYRSLPLPYSCKDDNFDAVEELLLVKGVTPEIYYGSGATGGENEYQGIKDYFTVWGSNEITLSTSVSGVLEAVFGFDTANNIKSQLNAGLIPSAVPGGKVTSNYFTIISTGFNRDSTIKRSIKVTAQKTAKGLETLYWNDNYAG